eukprot:6460126-Amphidinium_carterae.1
MSSGMRSSGSRVTISRVASGVNGQATLSLASDIQKRQFSGTPLTMPLHGCSAPHKSAMAVSGKLNSEAIATADCSSSEVREPWRRASASAGGSTPGWLPDGWSCSSSHRRSCTTCARVSN